MSDLFPNDWQVSNLNDLGQSYSGLKSKSKKDFDENGNASFVTYRNINRNYFVDELDLAPVHVQSTENQNVVKKGDVLFTGSSETPDEVAISSVMATEIDNLYLNSFCFGYRFNDVNKTLPDFYAYYFRGDNFRKTVFPLAQGSTRYNISKNELLKAEVPIPSKIEQQKIVAILSSVDEAIQKTEQIIEQTETVKKGLMQQLFSTGIGHTEFKDTPIGKIPVDWNYKQIKEVTEVVSGGTPSKNYAPYWFEGDIPWATPSDITKSKSKYISKTKANITELGLKKSSANLLPTGSVLMTSRATIGPRSINIVPMTTNQGFKSFICKDEILNNEFLYYLIDTLTERFKALSSGSTFPEISKSEIESFLIPLPPIEEQKQIAQCLNYVDSKLSIENRRKKALIKTKQGLMQQLLTGKVRVPLDEKEEVPS